MAVQNTPTTMNGMFKQLYSKELIDNLIPEGVWLCKNIPFKSDKKLGDYYHQPVVLGLEHGISYGGSAGNAFTLNAAVAAATKDAKIQGVEMVLRSAMSVAAASRSIESEAAFEKGTKFMVANMLRSMTKRLEISMFYGQSGIGTLASASGTNIVISADTFAPGIWSGMEGAPIEIFNGDTEVDTGVTFIVSAVNLKTRTIGVTGTVSSATTGHNVFFKGAKDGSTEYDMVGLYEICTNTGTLFNVAGASYSLWQGNNISTAQDISFSAIESAIADAVGKGLDEDVVCLVNVKHWAVLLDDIVAKRQFDSSYSKDMAVEGSKSIKFYGQNGMIEIVPSIYVKGAHCFIIPMSAFCRVGSTDVTFEIPGEKDLFFRPLADANGYELRAYSDQALFCTAPGKCIVFTDLNVG